MRFMHWSFEDFMRLPEYYRQVLVEEIKKENDPHQKAVAEAKARAKRTMR